MELKPPETRIADAALCSAAAKKTAWSAKVRSPARAFSAEDNPVSRVEPSPKISPRTRSAISETVKELVIGIIYSELMRLLLSMTI